MSQIQTPHDGALVTAGTLAQATAPLLTFEVQVVVSATGVIEVQAQSAQEATERAKRIPGVIWPIAARRKAQGALPKPQGIIAGG